MNQAVCWKPPLKFVPIVQEQPAYSKQFRNGQRIPTSRKRNKEILLVPSHAWLATMLKGHNGLICDMNFSYNGKYVASSAEDWDVQPEQYVQWQSSQYKCRSPREVNNFMIPYSNVPQWEINYQYQRQHPNRSFETRQQVTHLPRNDNEIRRDNKRRQLKFSNKNMDTNLDCKTKKQIKAAQDKNLDCHDNYLSLRRTIPLNDVDLYRIMSKYILPLEDLITRGYPMESSEFPGCAMINNIIYPSQNFTPYTQNRATDFVEKDSEEKNDEKDRDSGNCSNSSNDSASEHEESSSDNYDLSSQQIKRKCIRCHKPFYVDYTGKYLYAEQCVYHYGKLLDGRINGTMNCKYWGCCRGLENSPGCETGKVHVWSGLMLPGLNGPFEGYVYTWPPKRWAHDFNYSIYAVDCEMCYTQYGLELTKVTFVDLNGTVVYDEFVKPNTEIIDYNTRFSGITEKNMLGAKTFNQVQYELMTLVHTETILLGHNLASDLRMLRLFHTKVIDTAQMFPHYKGFPYCNSLKRITQNVLHRNIQEDTHDSIEDARAVIDLVLYKIHLELEEARKAKSP
ncbi:uncharacterized protein [Anoplolepis gracilipes]